VEKEMEDEVAQKNCCCTRVRRNAGEKRTNAGSKKIIIDRS
jgi:hypothetical protein